MAKVAMNRMSKGNTFYGRKASITSSADTTVQGRSKPDRTYKVGPIPREAEQPVRVSIPPKDLKVLTGPRVTHVGY